jgi:hypothetical protein
MYSHTLIQKTLESIPYWQSGFCPDPLARSGNLPDQIETALLEMSTDAFIGDGTDIIDAVSVPILMIVSAVEEMANVESIATEVIAAEKNCRNRKS